MKCLLCRDREKGRLDLPQSNGIVNHWPICVAVCAATGQIRESTNRENNIFFMPYFIDLLLFDCYTLISSFLIRYHLFFFRTKIHFIVGLNGDLYLFHILG